VGSDGPRPRAARLIGRRRVRQSGRLRRLLSCWAALRPGDVNRQPTPATTVDGVPVICLFDPRGDRVRVVHRRRRRYHPTVLERHLRGTLAGPRPARPPSVPWRRRRHCRRMGATPARIRAEPTSPSTRSRMDGGPVIKFNATGSYATDARARRSCAMEARESRGCPCSRSWCGTNLPCGSEPSARSPPRLGLELPRSSGRRQLSMHSARETADRTDHPTIRRPLAANCTE